MSILWGIWERCHPRVGKMSWTLYCVRIRWILGCPNTTRDCSVESFIDGNGRLERATFLGCIGARNCGVSILGFPLFTVMIALRWRRTSSARRIAVEHKEWWITWKHSPITTLHRYVRLWQSARQCWLNNFFPGAGSAAWRDVILFLLMGFAYCASFMSDQYGFLMFMSSMFHRIPKCAKILYIKMGGC